MSTPEIDFFQPRKMSQLGIFNKILSLQILCHHELYQAILFNVCGRNWCDEKMHTDREKYSFYVNSMANSVIHMYWMENVLQMPINQSLQMSTNLSS